MGMSMPVINPVPGQQAPSWVPQPGERGMPPAQGQPQQPAPQPLPPWQGPTPGWGPPTVPPMQPMVQQDYGTGYPASQIPPVPQRQQPVPFQQQPYQGQPQPQQHQFQQQPQQPPNPWQQVPVQQPQGQPGRGIDMNTVLDGPNIPIELRGRTFGEAVSTYAGLRNVVLQNMYGPGQSLPGSTLPQAVSAPSQQPQGVPAAHAPQGQPGQQPQGWDWRNPAPAIRAQVEQVIQETVMPALAPIHQQNMMQAINGARQALAQEIGVQNFAQVEPEALQLLQGVDPRALTNPQTWRIAVASALGMRQMRGGQAPQPPVAQQAWGQPQQVQPGQNPVPNLNSFFTERPGATARQDTQPQTLTPMELYVAQAMGKSAQDYLAWKGGISR